MQEGLEVIEATDLQAKILSSREFTVVPEGEDRCGRTLARFFVCNTTAGEMLVDEGLARPLARRQEEWCD